MNAENFVTLNGRKLRFEPDETILDIARRNSIFIPTLCHLPGATPTGACRVCVVEVEGARALIAACTMPAGAGMVIQTNSAKVLAARRDILALLLSSGNHNCSIRTQDNTRWTDLQQAAKDYDQSEELCEVYGACKLQALSYRYQVDSTRFAGRNPEYESEAASPLILRDFSRCILCGRCVQACNDSQVNNAISHGFRGKDAKIVAMGNGSLEKSECVFCGECIQACPVGALVEQKSRYQARPWDVQHIRTTCGYCSVGCQLDLHVKENRIMKVDGLEGAAPNDARLCMQGRFGFDFLTSPKRLTKPLVRENDKLREASWDEALERIAQKIKEIKTERGPDAIAGILSDKSANESLYLGQKLLRAVIGTNNVTTPFGATGMSNSLAELDQAKRILLIGSDVTTEHPVAGTAIKRAVKRGADLIVIDDRPTKIASFATLALEPHEGSEPVLINGIIQQLLSSGARSASGDLQQTAENFPVAKVTESTGIGADEIAAAAQMLGAEGPTMLVYGPKVAMWGPLFTQFQDLLGNLGQSGGGVNYLSALNNSVGAPLMGASHYLPGYLELSDAERARCERAWQCQLNETMGLTLPEIIAATSSGADPGIALLICAGEDLAHADPALPGAREAVKNVGFLVVIDILETETSAAADVVLPAAAWGEYDGTFTSCERRISRTRQAVAPPDEAQPETWIYHELARRLGSAWAARTNQAIWEEEITSLVPQVAGITYERIARDGLQWPVPDQASPGSPRFNGERAPLLQPQWHMYNYHHHALLAHCEGLMAAIPRERGGMRDWPSAPEEVNRHFEAFLTDEELTEKKAEVDAVLTEYRPRRGGLIPVLQKTQGMLGYLPVPVQNYVAKGLGLPAADVYGVVSFYSFFTMVPRGKHTVRVCLGTACYVKGAGKIVEKIVAHLKIKVGETTPDREFGLEAVRCLGACGLAPVVVVDEETHGIVDPAGIAAIVEGYRSSTDDSE